MLSGLEYAMAYLDDILIKSENFEEHKSHVREVFKRIEKYGFKVGLEKCEFWMNKIEYLGHIIDHEGRRPNPKRTEAIKNMPDNITKLQSFLGLANYYNLYIPNIHELRAPLNKLLSKNKKWCWTKECDNAFNKIKKYLSDLALAHYDPKKELVVALDANDYGIGAVLLHRFEDGVIKPIVHASRALLPAVRNYSQIKKERLAITYAVKNFHRFIHGRTFVLQTDHTPLLSILGSKKGVPTHSANRLQRWIVILLNYNFKIQYMPSKKIAHADGLSKLIPDNVELLEETVIAVLKQEKELTEVLINTVSELPVTLKEI